MDPLTQGLLGATAAQTGAKKDHLRPAAFTGAISAMVADLDYYLHIPSDPLFNIEIHRQFSHSFIFIPIGALIASVLLWWLLKKYLSFKELYIYSLLGYATAGLLDTFTSYGTQLLWPFLDTRFALNLISIIDPIVTLGLILFVGIALYKKEKKYAWFAGGWLIFFLLFGWIQHQRATISAKNLAQSRGHLIQELVVKPTIGNQRLWRSNYISNNIIYTDAIRTGLISGIDIYQGESAARIIIEDEFSEFENTVMFGDLLRFKRLSENFLVFHPEYPEVIGDARYSMLPTQLNPLWGVKVDTTQTENHLPFLYFRDANEEVRQEFLKMLLGK
jgi:inner membrane protein